MSSFCLSKEIFIKIILTRVLTQHNQTTKIDAQTALLLCKGVFKMSYEQNRKRIEIDETSLDDLYGTLDEVLKSIKDQHECVSDKVSKHWGFDTFVVIEERLAYYRDTETPHLVAYRWETEGEYTLRIRETEAKKDAQMQKELELLAKLKQKYEN